MKEAARVRATLERMPEAIGHFRAGRYGLAAECFEAILKVLPSSDHEAMAAALLKLKGVAHFRRLRSSVETNLGLCHLRSRRYESAVDLFRQAVRTDPRSSVAHSNLGVALLRLKRYPQARRAFEDALRRGGDGPRLHLNLGEAALRSGHPRRASQALRQTVRLARENPGVDTLGAWLEAERLLAEVAMERGRLREARRQLEGVLEETPGDPLPRYLLLRVLARQGDLATAAQHRRLFERHAATMASLQSVLAENPDEVAGLHWVADTYLSLGLDHLAAVHYRQLLARDREDGAARQGLLTVYSRVQKRKETHDD